MITDASMAVATVIDDVPEGKGRTAPSLEIHGSHLSQDASFRITGGTEDREIARDVVANNGRAKVLVSDPDDPGFAKALIRIVPGVPAAWLQEEWQSAKHNLPLLNPDGQKAVAPVTRRPPNAATCPDAGVMPTTPQPPVPNDGEPTGCR